MAVSLSKRAVLFSCSNSYILYWFLIKFNWTLWEQLDSMGFYWILTGFYRVLWDPIESPEGEKTNPSPPRPPGDNATRCGCVGARDFRGSSSESESSSPNKSETPRIRFSQIAENNRIVSDPPQTRWPPCAFSWASISALLHG